MIQYFLDYYNEKFNRQVCPSSHPVVQILQNYEWPGSTRQLENLIKQHVIPGSEDSIICGSLSVSNRNRSNHQTEIGSGGWIPLKTVTRDAVHEFEWEIIFKALQSHHRNRKRTAKALSISYGALPHEIRQAGLPSARARNQVEDLPTCQAAKV